MMRFIVGLKYNLKIFFLYCYIIYCFEFIQSLDDINYIVDEEFEQMLRAQHQLNLEESKRIATLDYGSGIMQPETSLESTVTFTLTWITELTTVTVPDSSFTNTIVHTSDVFTIETADRTSTVESSTDPCAYSIGTSRRTTQAATSTTFESTVEEFTDDSSAIQMWFSKETSAIFNIPTTLQSKRDGFTSIDPCSPFLTSVDTSTAESTTLSTTSTPIPDGHTGDEISTTISTSTQITSPVVTKSTDTFSNPIDYSTADSITTTTTELPTVTHVATSLLTLTATTQTDVSSTAVSSIVSDTTMPNRTDSSSTTEITMPISAPTTSISMTTSQTVIPILDTTDEKTTATHPSTSNDTQTTSMTTTHAVTSILDPTHETKTNTLLSSIDFTQLQGSSTTVTDVDTPIIDTSFILDPASVRSTVLPTSESVSSSDITTFSTTSVHTETSLRTTVTTVTCVTESDIITSVTSNLAMTTTFSTLTTATTYYTHSIFLSSDTSEPTSTTTESTSTTTTTATTTTTSTTTESTSTTTTTTTTTTSTTTESTSTTTTTTTTTSTTSESTSTTTTTTSTTSESTSTTTTTTTTPSTAIESTSTTTATTTVTVGTTSSATSRSTTTPRRCNITAEVELPNGACIARVTVQATTFQSLIRGSNNVNETLKNLDSYINVLTEDNAKANPNITLSLEDIDNIIKNLSDGEANLSSSKSFIMSYNPPATNDTLTLGASFTGSLSGGQIINNPYGNYSEDAGSRASAVIHNITAQDIKSLNMLIMAEPIPFKDTGRSLNQTIASPVIVAGLSRKNEINSGPVNISLYFTGSNSDQTNPFYSYSCSFYNTITNLWSDSGCTTTDRGKIFRCHCSHLTAFAIIRSPIVCPDEGDVVSINGTCIPKKTGQEVAANIILKNETNATVIADALSLYISAVANTSTSSIGKDVLTIEQIDNALEKVKNTSVEISKSDSYIIAQPAKINSEDILGASFTRGEGGRIVKETNQQTTLQTNVSVAAIIRSESLTTDTSINILIIDQPSAFENIDNKTNKTLASSIVVANVVEKNAATQVKNPTITLYFQVLKEYNPNRTDIYYFCSYYNTSTFSWQEDGCTEAIYQTKFTRYTCNCTHLTSFALLWLPRQAEPGRAPWNEKDIASLVFQSVSIGCFLIIIFHFLITKIIYPNRSVEARDLLPLISCAVTMLLFIFYIALGLTVYTRELGQNVTKCFLNAKILMFFVYFFLILMLCTKTSVGYFNYLRFVILFPEPSKRRLFVLLIISLFISIIWLSFAVAFDSNSSNKITQIHYGKICWFSGNNLYYFVTIPVGIFLVLNFFMIIRVSMRIIDHVRNATSPHQSYERMKRCVIVLLSSCMTQGLGWLFGPFISFVDPQAGNVLEWFFIIFNGLEGFWAIVLYALIRLQHLDERKRVTASKNLSKSKTTSTSSLDNEWMKTFYLTSKRDIRSSEC